MAGLPKPVIVSIGGVLVPLNTNAHVVEWFGSVAPTVGLKPAASSIPVVVALEQWDVALSTRASQATVASILAQLDVALSTRASEPTVAAILAQLVAQLDVALSTRASQATVASILAQLDVALSTRASEAALLALSAKVMPTGASGHSPVRASSALVKAAPGTLWTLYANNNTNVDTWLMTFDAVALPANGTAPVDLVQIPRDDRGEMGIFIPRDYATGIFWAASTTDDTLTLAAGAPLLARGRFT